MEQIMKQIDLDYDGKIQFTEFLIAGCNKRALFTAHNIEQWFTYIEMDGDKEITREDLSTFIGEDVGDYFVGNMIEDANDNCDGGL